MRKKIDKSAAAIHAQWYIHQSSIPLRQLSPTRAKIYYALPITVSIYIYVDRNDRAQSAKNEDIFLLARAQSTAQWPQRVEKIDKAAMGGGPIKASFSISPLQREFLLLAAAAERDGCIFCRLCARSPIYTKSS